MNTDTVFTKYADALYRISKQHGTLQPQAVDLALRLAIADAAALAQPVGQDPRTIERTFNQIASLNEWLEYNRLDLYFDDKLDTAQAILAALASLEERLATALEERATALEERATALEERATALEERDVAEAANRRLRDWLHANVAEHSDLDDTDLVIHTITALRAQLATPVGHVSNVTEPPLVHTAGVDPTPAAQSGEDWGRSHQAWSGLPKADLDVIDQLNSGLTTFRRLSATLRRDLAGRVIRHLATDGYLRQHDYETQKPGWMATATAIARLAPDYQWQTLLAEVMAA